jgi:hypothetical protein
MYATAYPSSSYNSFNLPNKHSSSSFSSFFSNLSFSIHKPRFVPQLAIGILALVCVWFLSSRLFGHGSTDAWDHECFQCTPLSTSLTATTPGISKKNSPNIFIGIISKCTNVVHREAIRTTWASQIPPSVTVRFFIGKGASCGKEADIDRLVYDGTLASSSSSSSSTSSTTTAPGGNINTDPKRNNRGSTSDIVRLDVEESYINLPSKVLAMFSYITTLRPKPVLIIKVDDDIYVDIPRLLQRIENLQSIYPSDVWTNKGIYGGYFHNSTLVSHDSTDKWVDPSYPLTMYPPYAGGGAYYVTTRIMEWLAEGKKRNLLTTTWRNEDASLGTWLIGLDIIRVHDEGYLRCIDCHAGSNHITPWSIHLSRVADEQNTRYSSIKTNKEINPDYQVRRAAFLAQEMTRIHNRIQSGTIIRGTCCPTNGGYSRTPQ